MYSKVFGSVRRISWSAMVLTSNDGFLSGLTKLFQSSRTSGSVWITMKKCEKFSKIKNYFLLFQKLTDNGQTKPKPKPRKKGVAQKGGGPSPPEQLDDNLCLLRATNGKKKISTIVRTNK